TYATDAWVFTDVTGNYNNANGIVSDVIAKANATINVSPYNVTYNGLARTATGTARGVLSENLAGLNLSGTIHTNAGTYATDPWVFADVTGNYNNANGTVSDAIAKAVLTVTADNKAKYCGQENPPLTVSIIGFVNSETSAVIDVLPTATTAADVSSILSSYSIIPANGVDNNYSFNYANGVLTINGVTIDANASSTPIPLGSTATLSAKVTPAVAGVLVKFYMDGILKATVTTNSLGIATYAISGLAADVYKIEAIAGGGCASSIAYLPVYDPNGGFVTGGGWINSPAGAYVANATLVGKANFGFVSKYKKGSNVPEGNTEFQFQAGNLNFASSAYDLGSLVVAGSQAIYKGVGTINGTGQYGFMVSAVDGQVNGGGNIDKFRIKIWNKITGAMVYDNNLGMDDNGVPTTVLGGGSIVIHDPKKTARMETATTVIATPFNVVTYPNPTNSEFNLVLETDTSEKLFVEVYDLLGRKVKQMEENYQQPIRFGNDLPAGSYIAIIKQGVNVKTIKLIKQK
ncbi:T9SS type A sorting domain-containing protein, partial [Flavobacterium sp. GSN2]